MTLPVSDTYSCSGSWNSFHVITKEMYLIGNTWKSFERINYSNKKYKFRKRFLEKKTKQKNIGSTGNLLFISGQLTCHVWKEIWKGNCKFLASMIGGLELIASNQCRLGRVLKNLNVCIRHNCRMPGLCLVCEKWME